MRHLLLCFSLSLFLFGITFQKAEAQKTYVVDGSTLTFADAVLQANGNFGADIIQFNLPAGQEVIDLGSTQIDIKDAVTIDGTTNPGYLTIPVVSIKNGLLYFADNLPTYSSAGSSIKGIHFASSVISNTSLKIYNTNNVSIDGCHFQTDLSTGDFIPDASLYGIVVENCSDIKIGLTTPNVVYGTHGISIRESVNCMVSYNMINVTANGSNPGGPVDYTYGIELLGGKKNTVLNNTIGNCQKSAIFIDLGPTSSLSSDSNTIRNNNLGDFSGTYINGRGIFVSNGDDNIIDLNNIYNSDPNLLGSGAAIELSPSSTGNFIDKNKMSCNGDGIVLAKGNQDYSAPLLNAAYPIVSNSINITGTAQPNDKVVLYAIQNPCSGKGVQGEYFLGETVAASDGKWTIAYSGSIFAVKVTALATSKGTNNTSAFSTAADLVNCNYPITISSLDDDLLCARPDSTYYLNAYVSDDGYTPVVWTTSGKGSFGDVNNASTYYKYNSEDIAAGSVTFTATTNTVCPVYSEDMILTLTASPTAIVVSDTSICITNAASIGLTGTVVNSAGGTWTSGSGSFIGTFDNSSDLTTVYHPSPQEISMGNINLTLTPLPSGTCPGIGGSTLIHINSPMTANAGEDNSICTNNSFPLFGTINVPNEGDNSGVWTTNGSGTFVNLLQGDIKAKGEVQMMGYSYKPSPADTLAGTVLLIYSSVVDNGCGIARDTMKLTINPGPFVEITSDTLVCKTSNVNLTAVVKNASNFQWSTYSEGNFTPNAGTVNAVYHPTEQDTTDGSVLLTLRTLDEGLCGTTQDNIRITFVSAPVVNSGADQLICQGNSVELNGIVIASKGAKHKWSTTGKGAFVPSPDSLEVTYMPSAQDNRKVALTFSLKATQSVCKAVSDEQLVVLLPLPSVGQGTQQQICPENSIVMDAIDPELDQYGYWSVLSGSGVFADSTNPNPTITDIENEVNIYKWTIVDSTTGCVNATEYTVYKCYQPDLNIYNVVSPNGDGIHDFFEIENIDAYKGNKVTILNRWGDTVFKIADYDNKENVFTGKSNLNGNAELEEGIYYFQIEKNNKLTKGFLVLRK